MDVVYFDECRYEIREQKEVPVYDDPFRALHISNCFRFRTALKRKQYDPLTPWHLHTSSNGVTKQKTKIHIFTAVRT
jgi:hypothetical protein